MSRLDFERRWETVETEYGSVRVKVARAGERTIHFLPEYDDCARLAALTATPVLEVQSAAAAAYRKREKRNIKHGEPKEER